MGDFRVSEVRVRLNGAAEDKLIGYCTLTINDSLVVKDIKIINSDNGPFVAMPSRKRMNSCHRCRGKNHIRASFCNDCGVKLNPPRGNGRVSERFHFDVVHPVNATVRAIMHDAVMREIDRIKNGGENNAPPIDDGDDG